MQENWILAIIPIAQIWKFGPRPPENDFFGNFWFLWKGLWILFLTSPQRHPDIKFKSSYARKLDFSLSELTKGTTVFLKASESLYFLVFFTVYISCFIIFSLLCPNMEIRPQAPENDFFQKFLIFMERSLDFASCELSTTPRH